MKIKVLNLGYVELMDYMGNDFTPESTARISTNKLEDDRSNDQKVILTRYLMRHFHSSPFEFVQVTFEVNAPIFVIREWFRHRTQSYNEQSARYTKLDNEYFVPEFDRIVYQSKENKQGSSEDGFEEYDKFEISEMMKREQSLFEESYSELIKDGLTKEIARTNMPVSHYSKFRVSANLLNWFRFLQLRNSEFAQKEIRVYAEAIEKILTDKFPECMRAFKDYWKDTFSLSSSELQLLKEMLLFFPLKKETKEINLLHIDKTITNCHWTNREKEEFKKKIKDLGFIQ